MKQVSQHKIYTYFERSEKQAQHQTRFQRDGAGLVSHRASHWCGSSRRRQVLIPSAARN